MISELVNFTLFSINCMIAGYNLHKYVIRNKSDDSSWIYLSSAIAFILLAASMLFD